MNTMSALGFWTGHVNPDLEPCNDAATANDCENLVYLMSNGSHYNTSVGRELTPIHTTVFHVGQFCSLYNRIKSSVNKQTVGIYNRNCNSVTAKFACEFSCNRESE